MNRISWVTLSLSTVLYGFSGFTVASTVTLLGSSAAIAQVPLQAQLNDAMTSQRLEEILENQDDVANIQSQPGQLQFTLNNRSLIVLFNEERDRMRIVSPVVSADKLTPEQIQTILTANFHTALDARYALTNGTLVSVFIHRLSSLQDNDFRSAINQVASLAENFGTTYSSSEIIFGPDGQPQQRDPEVNGDLEI